MRFLCCSSEGGDEVVDIEAIDELEGIMDAPDSRQTFTSTGFLPGSRSLPKKNVVVIEKGTASATNVTPKVCSM